jgi:hypothetical protein
MTLKDISMLSCKIIAITVFIKFVLYSQSAVFYFTQEEIIMTNDKLIQLFLLPLGYLIIGIILWFFAKNISSHMVNNTADLNKIINLNLKEIKPFIFSVIGIFLLASANPALVKNLYNIISYALGNSGATITVNSFYLGLLIESVLKILIAVYLLIGPKKVLHFIKFTRTLGVTKERK